MAIFPNVRRASSVLLKVDDAIGFDELCVLKSWLYVQRSILNKDIFIGSRRLLKLPIARICISL